MQNKFVNSNKLSVIFQSAKKNSINFLGKIPIDDLISKNGDKGIPFLIENNETDAGKKIMEIASYIDKKIK